VSFNQMFDTVAFTWPGARGLAFSAATLKARTSP
jgi:hypothetical protein